MKDHLIMIPGTLCDASLFHHQVQAFSDFAQCTIGDHSSSDALQRVAANILDSTEGDFSVMGLSYGGIIAFEMWRQAPERMKRLILLNTTFKLPSSETRITQQRFVSMARRGEFKEIIANNLKDAMLHPDHALMPGIRKHILDMALGVGKDKFYKQIKSQLGRPDSTADLPFIKCPTLIITGRQDKVCTPEIHAQMAAMIPNSTLEIIENCGHLTTLEQPGKVNEVIRKWWLTTDALHSVVNQLSYEKE
ncbi:MAG: alpha/beta hydrolase [Chitinophagaceae bacterium]